MSKLSTPPTNSPVVLKLQRPVIARIATITEWPMLLIDLEEGRIIGDDEIKQKLAAGKTVYGAMVQFPDPDLVEMLGYGGFDWILVDAEHGSINENDCAAIVRACELADTTSIVRPPMNHPEVIMRFMDRGAQGVQVPHVNTAAEARAAVAAVKYAPLGTRGMTSAARSAALPLGTQ